MGDNNVCCEQAMVIFSSKSGGYDYERDLKQGEDDVSNSLETLPNNFAG